MRSLPERFRRAGTAYGNYGETPAARQAVPHHILLEVTSEGGVRTGKDPTRPQTGNFHSAEVEATKNFRSQTNRNGAAVPYRMPPPYHHS
jgi:hypothetical protein